MRRDPKDTSEARHAIRQCRGTFLMTGFFSFFINLLMLTIPLYMLLVYDRVLTSGNHSTLIALSVLVGILLAIMGTLEFLRSRILVRIGGRIDRALSSRVFDAFMKRARTSGTDKGERPLQDLNTFKDFLSGQGPLALFDAPWAPIYLAVLFLLHPLLGLVATGGALVLFTIAVLNELTTRGPLGAAAKLQDKAGVYAADGQRNAEVLGSMGMLGGLRERWQWYHRYARRNQAKASDRAGGFTACSKTTRLALQAAILGTGATLAIEQIITPGAMIAASIIMGRGLQPVEQAIGNWRHFNAARAAFRRLDALLRQVPASATPTRLPVCKGYLAVEKLYAGPPEAQKPLLTNIRFHMFPGQALGIIGPSSSGKSTLVRLLTGIWQPQHGAVQARQRHPRPMGSGAVGPQYRLPAAGCGAVLGNREGEHFALRRRRRRRGGGRRRAARRCPRHDPRTARRLRNPDRRRRQQAVRRPAPAHRARPRTLWRSGPGRARRAKLQSRRRRRGRFDGGHPRFEGPRPDRDRRRPPPERHLRHGQGPGARQRHPEGVRRQGRRHGQRRCAVDTPSNSNVATLNPARAS